MVGRLDGQTRLFKPEEIACKNATITDLKTLTRFYVDVPLLTSQLGYYKYVDDLLNYVNYEARVRAGKISTSPFQEPKKVKHPLFHIPSTEERERGAA